MISRSIESRLDGEVVRMSLNELAAIFRDVLAFKSRTNGST